MKPFGNLAYPSMVESLKAKSICDADEGAVVFWENVTSWCRQERMTARSLGWMDHWLHLLQELCSANKNVKYGCRLHRGAITSVTHFYFLEHLLPHTFLKHCFWETFWDTFLGQFLWHVCCHFFKLFGTFLCDYFLGHFLETTKTMPQRPL